MSVSMEQNLIPEIISGLSKALTEAYVFPETAERMVAALEQGLAQGEFSASVTPAELCEALTTRLQSISRDKHLRVWHISTQPDRVLAPGSREEYAQRVALLNGGFNRVERLPGGVGYLELRNFYDPAIVGDVATAAMNFLANCQAIIFDLRQNGGGTPSMVALISTYLFDRPVHLNSLYFRPEDQLTQFWTLSHVPGKVFGGSKPVYVLTSRKTFSAAEEFAYNLKNLKRATLVGETTGGGANPGGVRKLPGEFSVFVPSGRAISPITQTNWEGTGVAPDIAVPAAEAYDTAYAEALTQVIAAAEQQQGGPWQMLKEEARTALAGLKK